jgi:DNA-binding LacI/PurR family transcriptional regulator
MTPNPGRAGEQPSSKPWHGSAQAGPPPPPAPSRSGAVALIVFEPHTLLFSDPFLPRLIGGVEATLHERGMHSVLLAPQSAPDCDWTATYVAGGHADAAMLVSFPGSHPLAGQLAARGIPVVFGGRPAQPARFGHVDVDNVTGASHAVAHLAAGGRRTIATITGRRDVPAAQDRLRGYRQGLEAAGLPTDEALVEDGDFTRDGGARAMRFLLSIRPQLDAVFAASDLMAAGALQVLSETGRRVPKDVAVVGYDDDPFAASLQPPLTSVRQPIERMGREMAAMVVNALHSPDRSPQAVTLSTRLEVRLSSAPVAGVGSSGTPERGGSAG